MIFVHFSDRFMNNKYNTNNTQTTKSKFFTNVAFAVAIEADSHTHTHTFVRRLKLFCVVTVAGNVEMYDRICITPLQIRIMHGRNVP